MESDLGLNHVGHAAQVRDQFGDGRHHPAMGVWVSKPVMEEEGDLLQDVLRLHILYHVRVLSNHLCVCVCVCAYELCSLKRPRSRR